MSNDHAVGHTPDSVLRVPRPRGASEGREIPEGDSAPREEDRPPLPKPEDWGVTAEEARDMLKRQMCPVCGEGPWRSPLNHVSRGHGINRHVMREVCLLSMADKVTDEAVRDAWIQNGKDKSDTLRANAAKNRGSRGKKLRMTPAFRASLGKGLRAWEAEHPEEAAAARAGFWARASTPEARAAWEESMRRVRAEREYTDEERAEFRDRMNRPDVVAKRDAERAARTLTDCSIEGCERPHVARGLCNLHWRRLHETGDAGHAEALTPHEAGIRGGRKAKLTPAQMAEVIAACDGGESQGSVASRYGISQSAVSRVIHGQVRGASSPVLSSGADEREQP